LAVEAISLIYLNPATQPTKAEVLKEPAKGLHILSNFETKHSDLLKGYQQFRHFIDLQVCELELSKVGEAYHDFPGGGFTAVICLAESHLSIHTWPDLNYATFDVYLSNHSRDNSAKAEAIYLAVIQFFSAQVLYENQINR
jgi:S-adenosylmethionine decarboxylase